MDATVTEQRMEELRKPKYREVTMNVSAYTYHEGGDIGAWGDTLQLGDCASDDLPYGTKVVVGGKEYTVRDRFGGGYKNRLDIYYGSDLDGAWEFGRRTMKVKVKEE